MNQVIQVKMEIKEALQKMNSARSEAEKKEIEKLFEAEFKKLTEKEKIRLRNDWKAGFTSELEDSIAVMSKIVAMPAEERKDLEGRIVEDALLHRVYQAVELEEVSRYVSMAKISEDFFGKRKTWLYQRLKGYNVNGKPAQFTPEERKKLAEALEHISQLIHETALKIA